jgi:S-adenosylmethionine-diacylglycerol 3-amino-3-carboxypropyl transferase
MASEIQSRARFDQVRYALCWEDPALLIAGLRPHPGGHYLSIGSAGDNALALLAAGAGHVTIAELNPTQIACIDLRVAAWLELGHGELLELLGLTASARRKELYQAVRGCLNEQARAFWDGHPCWNAEGPAHAGKFENYFRLFRERVLLLAHSRRRVSELLQARAPEDRATFYEQKWNNWRWRAIFHCFFSRFTMGLLGRDPEFFRYVEGSVAARILERTRHALVELDPSSNPWLRMILTGSFGPHLPPAFLPGAFHPIREALRANRLTIHACPIEDVRGLPPVDGFNLSDIFEYMSEDSTRELLTRLAAMAKPGARLAYWNMLAPRSRPESLAGILSPLEDEAQALFRTDRAFFYSRFVLEEVRG